MLGLHFDAASWYDDADWEDVPQEHYLGRLAHRSSRSRVYSLSVSTSPIEGQSQVAYFLARTFPQLCELFTVHEPWDEEEEEEERMVIRKRWEEVARYIPLFAHIRLDERRRLKLDAGGKDDEEGMKRTVMTKLTASLMRDHWRTKHEVCMPVLSVSPSWTDARGR